MQTAVNFKSLFKISSAHLSMMESIKACIRIKPPTADIQEEIVCTKFEENSVVNLKTNEKFDFGTISHFEY